MGSDIHSIVVVVVVVGVNVYSVDTGSLNSPNGFQWTDHSSGQPQTWEHQIVVSDK